jgi:DNA-binding LacI/PurR family transcriptional regulator
MNRLPQRSSLATQTAAVISEEISVGRWVRWLPGEHELCSLLHVSRKTVRAALEQLRRAGVIKCCRGKRREIIQQEATKLKRVSSRVIFLIPVPLHSLSPFGIFLIDRLREHLAEEGLLLEIHSGRLPYRARVPGQLKVLEETLHPVGWVLSQSTEQMQRWFFEHQLPCVVLGSCYPGIKLPSVDTDFAAVCRHAVGQFLARGHRRIVLLNPKLGAAGDLKAEKGFLEAVHKTSLSGVEASIAYHDGMVGSICSRLDGLMRLAHPPTALLVSRAHHVLTVLGHLLSNRLRVPQDVAIISRDDESFLENVVPAPTRYSGNPDVFASKLSRAVLDTVRGNRAVTERKIMPNFTLGSTLG